MKIIDKYISKHFLIILISANVISMLLFLLASVLDQLTRLMVRRGLSFFEVVIYFLYQVPQLYYYCAPLSVIFALLLMFGILNQHRELVIMQGVGLSWWRLLRLPFIYTVIYAWLMWLVGGWLIPFSNQKVREFEKKEIKKKINMPITDLKLISKQNSHTYYAVFFQLFLPELQSAKGVLIYKLDSDFFPEIEYRAERARYLKGKKWRLRNVEIHKYHRFAPKELEKRKKLILNLGLTPFELISFEKMPDELSISLLKKYIVKLKKFGLNPREFIVELQSRYSLPFACLVLFALGLGVAIRQKQTRGLYINFAWALFFSFTYFAVMAMCLSMGKSGKIPSLISPWIANMVFSGVAVYLLLFQEK